MAQKYFLFFLLTALLFVSSGCESFARKFTRKSKRTQAVEMVITPEEYKGPNMTKEELYRQYYLYWKSWQDELINSITYKASLKKKLDCAQEALKQLTNMKVMLVEEAQKNFDPEITRLNGLILAIKNDVYGSNDAVNLQTAQKIKAGIEKNFIFPKIKNYLK